MKVPRSSARPRARRYIAHLLFSVTLTTTMIATRGFGTLPENPITKTFQIVIGEAAPPELLESFNAYMDQVSAPQIPPAPASESDGDSQPDPAGAILNLFEETAVLPTATNEQLARLQTTLAALASTQTQVAFIQTAPVDWAQTQTQAPLITPSQTSTSTETHTPAPTETLNLTQTQTLTHTFTPSATWTVSPTLQDTDTPTLTMTPTVIPSAIVIIIPSDTPTSTPVPTVAGTPVIAEGSCVKNSPNTSTYGCLVSNILLDGVNQTTLTVSSGQNFTFSYSYQVWSDPANPTGALQIIAGLESVSALTCDYQNSPGVHPGQTGGSYTHTFTAPSTPGSYGIFIRWIQESGCNLANYGGYGTVIALITVP